MERAELIRLARRRTREITDRVLQEKVATTIDLRRQRRVIQATKIFVRGTKVTGLENIDLAIKKSENSRLIVINNHFADSDHSIRRIILDENGYKEFADKLFYLAGLKMDERWYTEKFMGAENTVYIPTPADFAVVEKYLAQGSLAFYERSVLERYLARLRLLQDRAKDAVNRFTQQGLILSYYPEAGRNRKLRVGRAPKESAGVIGRTGVLLPIVVYGHEESLPAERLPNPLKRGVAQMVIGEPFLVEEVWEYARGRTNGQKNMAIDYIMAKLAENLPPYYIDPEYYPRFIRILAKTGSN